MNLYPVFLVVLGVCSCYGHLGRGLLGGLFGSVTGEINKVASTVTNVLAHGGNLHVEGHVNQQHGYGPGPLPPYGPPGQGQGSFVKPHGDTIVVVVQEKPNDYGYGQGGYNKPNPGQQHRPGQQHVNHQQHHGGGYGGQNTNDNSGQSTHGYGGQNGYGNQGYGGQNNNGYGGHQNNNENNGQNAYGGQPNGYNGNQNSGYGGQNNNGFGGSKPGYGGQNNNAGQNNNGNDGQNSFGNPNNGGGWQQSGQENTGFNQLGNENSGQNENTKPSTDFSAPNQNNGFNPVWQGNNNKEDFNKVTEKPKPYQHTTTTTKNPADDYPLFVPLSPNDYAYGGDKITVNEPKRETQTNKPAENDEEFPIDIRFKDE